MNLETLNRLYDANVRIYEAKQLYNQILLRAQPGAQKLDGMPHGSGISDKVANAGIELADLMARIKHMEEEITPLRKEATSFIDEIQDLQLAECFRLRYFGTLRDGNPLQFDEIPDYTTKYRTTDAVKSSIYGYLSKQKGG